MPKIAHTMAIPPGFPAYRRRDMRAKKSSKNLLRISGLALVFMLAVALLVSAISFTRVGAGENQTSFASGTYTPGTQELAIGSPSWNWNVPLKANADGNIAVYTYRPSTYRNYFSYVGGMYSTSVEVKEKGCMLTINCPMNLFRLARRLKSAQTLTAHISLPICTQRTSLFP